jgi:hypothetical protein
LRLWWLLFYLFRWRLASAIRCHLDEASDEFPDCSLLLFWLKFLHLLEDIEDLLIPVE